LRWYKGNIFLWDDWTILKFWNYNN
jgi:hypothetical protein